MWIAVMILAFVFFIAGVFFETKEAMVAGVVLFLIMLGTSFVMFSADQADKIQRCEQKGGVFLPRDNICMRGEVVRI